MEARRMNLNVMKAKMLLVPITFEDTDIVRGRNTLKLSNSMYNRLCSMLYVKSVKSVGTFISTVYMWY